MENHLQILPQYEPSPVIELDDQRRHPEAVPNKMQRQAQQRQLEPDPQVWRGVFSPLYKWRTLFSHRVKIKTAELPRLKPVVIIDCRMFKEEDD
jgi:hypothetical protein